MSKRRRHSAEHRAKASQESRPRRRPGSLPGQPNPAPSIRNSPEKPQGRRRPGASPGQPDPKPPIRDDHSAHSARHPLLAWAFGLLAAGAFLTPLIGGHVSVDALPLEPGLGALIASLWASPETATLAHFLIALCFTGAPAVLFFGSKVVQTPVNRLIVPGLVLVGAILLSLSFSLFRWQSAVAAMEWSLYLAAFLAVVAVAGRGRGPVILLAALVAGCFLVAFAAIREYQAIRVQDPTWRVIANWTNSNALAGMLLFGFFGGLALLVTQHRLAALVSGAATVVIGFALALTQSKGGYLALLAGLVAFAVCAAFWAGLKNGRIPALRAVVVIAVLILAVVSLRFAPSPSGAGSGSGGVLSRLSNAGATAEQSGEFRKMLWKTAWQIANQNPLGTGIGTFRYYSTRPGLTTQTFNSHQSYLQLGSEAGVLAPLALFAMGAIWLFECFRGARKLPPERNLLRAGCVAAVVAAGVHNAIDSDLYYFGTGIALFLMLGIGAVLSADALAPEQLPGRVRVPVAVAVITACAFLGWLGWVEALKGRVLGDLQVQNVEGALAGAEQLRSLTWGDADALLLLANLEPKESRLATLREAAARGPSPKAFRALAREYQALGNTNEAENAFSQALLWDPNNLLALRQLWRMQVESGRAESAELTAKRLVGLEANAYFTVRAIPEIVPTETYEARVFLASRASLPARIALLRPAVDGYKRYMQTTVPYVLSVLKGDTSEALGGVTIEDLLSHLEAGANAARLLSQAYRASGELESAGKAEEDAALFDATLGELRDLVK